MRQLFLPLLLLAPTALAAQSFGLQTRGEAPSITSPHSLALDPPPIEHRFEGRFGVAYIRDAGAPSGRLEPLAGLRYTLTLNHQLDSGARLSFSFAVEGEHFGPGARPHRPW